MYSLKNIFLSITIIASFFLFSSNIGVNIDSARLLLSTLAQSQAAIVAIVITLTLVALQLTTQSYSNRAIRLFIKQKELWGLLFVYLSSISIDIFILSVISDTSLYLEVLIGISILLFLVAASALFSYTSFVMKKLNPQIIINDLARVDEEELAQEINDLVKTKEITFESFNEETIIRPIVDISKASIIKRDFAIAIINSQRNFVCDKGYYPN